MGEPKPLSKQDPLAFLRVLPLLWLSIAFLLGIALASWLSAPVWSWLLLAGITAPVLWITGRKQLGWLLGLAGLVLLSLCFGAARFIAAQPHFDETDLAYYNDQADWVELTGLIIKPPVVRDGYIELRIEAEKINIDDQIHAVSGLTLARVGIGQALQYGDRVLLAGPLETPRDNEDFSYRNYLERQGINSLMPFANFEVLESGQGNLFWSALYSFRDRALEVVYQLYPDPEASLLAGILLGDESGLNESLKTAFNDTGTRHIIAISGFNISIIAGLLLAVFSRWIGVRRGIWLTALGIGMYTLLVGAESSVVRAAIMGTLALIARQVGRQQYALNTLAFSAGVMALINPLVLWDVGFQLSFAATLGLILYADPLRVFADKWLHARLNKDWVERLRGPLYEFVFLTVAAQITTLPLLLYHFERLSLLSLPANLLILPVQPALMVFGGFSLMLGLIWLPLGAFVSLFAWPLIAYTIRIVEALASSSVASQTVDFFSSNFVILYYLALLTISVPAMRTRITIPRLQPSVALVVLATTTFWLWSSAMAAPTGKLELTLLDVNGEAFLIRTPAGRSLLINGGSDATELTTALGRQLPPFNRDIDWLLVAGNRPDQVGALLPSLDRLTFGSVAWAISENPSRVAATVYQGVEGRGFDPVHLQTPQSFDLGAGAHLDVASIGQHGAILLLSWDNFQALLPLGLDFDHLEILDYGNVVGQVDLLLLADSGYAPLNPPEWIANLDPDVIWLAGDRNELDRELLDVIASFRLLDTAVHGWLRVSTDGQRMWLDVDH